MELLNFPTDSRAQEQLLLTPQRIGGFTDVIPIRKNPLRPLSTVVSLAGRLFTTTLHLKQGLRIAG